VPTLLSSDFDGAQQSLTVSLVALTSAVLATLVGFPAAYALAPLRFPGRGLLEVVVSLPLVFPAVSFGIGLLILLEATGSRRPPAPLDDVDGRDKPWDEPGHDGKGQFKRHNITYSSAYRGHG